MNLIHLFDMHCYQTGEASADGRQTLAGIDDRIGDYAARALLLPGKAAIVPKDVLIDASVADLRTWGIGPQEIIQVPGDRGLYSGVLDCSRTTAILRHHVNLGGKIQVFNPTASCWSFCEQLGVHRGVLHNRPEDLTALTDKIGFRRLAAELGLRRAFPEHRFATQAEEVRAAARELFLLGHRQVFIKRPDLASGTGMIKVGARGLNGRKLNTFLSRYAGSVELIVEAAWGQEDYSFVFDVNETSWTLEYVTGQFMEADRKTHAGNFLGATPKDCLPADWNKIKRGKFICTVLDFMTPMIDQLRKRGYRGKLCVDVRGNHRGEARLLELNARASASNFPHAVLEQVRNHYGHKELGAVMLNVWLPNQVERYEDLRALIGNDLFDPTTGFGIVPGNILCVRHQRPKFSPVMVQPSVAGAVAALLAFKQRIERRRPDLIYPDHLATVMVAK